MLSLSPPYRQETEAHSKGAPLADGGTYQELPCSIPTWGLDDRLG